MKTARIRNSGRKGAESGALKAAIKVGIPITGWRSKNEECIFSEIKETPLTKTEQKLIWNVRDSHATLILDLGERTDSSDLEYEVAVAYGRPVMESADSKEIALWLNTLGDEIILNVTGPDETEYSGAETEAERIMDEVFQYYNRMLI